MRISENTASLIAENFNQNPLDFVIDRFLLDKALKAEGLDSQSIAQSHPGLFAAPLVFVGCAHLNKIARFIKTVEAVIHHPAYQKAALAHAPEIALYDPGYPGLCLGYDFHWNQEGIQLIEINTNAGGVLLNALLAKSQTLCLQKLPEKTEGYKIQIPQGDKAQEILAMFQNTWRDFRGDQPLKRLAIVDTDPPNQYLAPEFQLYRRLFEAVGIEAFIAPPSEFSWDGKNLKHYNKAVDLVYNRLTDFSLHAPEHAPLRLAYLAGGILLTPHPRAHALYAHKRNLTLLSDPVWLKEAGIPEKEREILLSGIPRAVPVKPEAAESFWQERKNWFFKPAAGFGSRAVYRGDKLTRRVFQEILEGDYIAQRLAPPALRRIEGNPPGENQAGSAVFLKSDLRVYAHQGKVQMAAARLYQGQTTSFRTPGGGFALVLGVQ